MRVAWCITGSGHLLEETIQQFKGRKVFTFLSRAGEEVLRAYNLREDVETASDSIYCESAMGSSFPVAGAFMLKKFDLVIIAPATANTIAKIRFGIADSLVSNIVAQALKADSRVAVLPTDAQEHVETKLPYNAKDKNAKIKTARVHCRKTDIENVLELKKQGILVLNHPKELKELL